MNKSVVVFLSLTMVASVSAYLLQRGGSSYPGFSAAREPQAQVSRPAGPAGAGVVQDADPGARPIVLPVLSFNEQQQLTRDGEEFLRIANHPYSRLGEERLRELAVDGDARAQEMLAFEISTQHPDQALEWAKRAAEQGRPLAAILVSDILGQAHGDPARGYAYLVQFERDHGENSLASRYRKKYPVIYATSPRQIEAQANLLLQNEARGRAGLPAPTVRQNPINP